jgi:hypothetical protein
VPFCPKTVYHNRSKKARGSVKNPDFSCILDEHEEAKKFVIRQDGKPAEV